MDPRPYLTALGRGPKFSLMKVPASSAAWISATDGCAFSNRRANPF